MRCVAGAGILALVGCNQVFGIASTQVFDASSDVTVDMPHVELTWQVAQVIEAAPGQPEPANLGDPDPRITFPPITPAPRIRIATLTGAFDEDTASYSASDGWILIPRSYVGITWRLEYTLSDGIPREIQWAPEDKRGRLVVPMFGRIDRTAVPTGGGYTITPPQLPAAYDKPRVLTTGMWTEGIISVVPAPTTPPDRAIDYDFANSVSLSGPRGRPARARGDRALLVDYAVDGSCRIARGAADFPADLLLGMHSVVMPTWDTGSRAVLRPAIGLDVLARLTQNLGSLGGMVTGSIVVGHAANLEMPSLTETSPALPLPVPMMQILAQCEYTPPELPPAPAILTPAALANFPIIGHIQLTEVRTLQDTISVTSGMETVLTAVSGPTAFSFDIVFPAAFPTMIRLVPDGGPAIDLVNGTQDHIPVGPTGTFTLSFAPEVPEMGSNIQSDYYEVVLHKVGRAALTTQRIYTVTVPSVRIDPSVLAPATEYVFEVRSYKGRPMAARGDFIPVDYPYGAAIVFTHSFKTS